MGQLAAAGAGPFLDRSVLKALPDICNCNSCSYTSFVNTTTAPQGCTHFRIRRLMRQVGRSYDIEVAKSGLKTTQYSLLSHVLHLGPLKPGELARAMGTDASTLTRNLRPLIDAGLLAQAEGSDARSRLVSITPAGRRKRAQAQRHWRRAQEQLNERLGVERVSALHALIDESLLLLRADDAGDDPNDGADVADDDSARAATRAAPDA